MNWQDYPHLFSNGKFKLKTVEGFIVDFFGYKSNGWALTLGKYREEDWDNINGCQLIARPISDMTDEEFLDCAKLMNEPFNRETAESFQKFIKEEGWLPSNIFLYLLSIGVYPFDQEAFEIGEVLDAKEAV